MPTRAYASHVRECPRCVPGVAPLWPHLTPENVSSSRACAEALPQCGQYPVSTTRSRDLGY